MLLLLQTAGGTSHAVAGAVAGESAVAGALSVARPVAGFIAGISTIAGAASIARTLAGAVAGESAVTGALIASYALAGNPAAESTMAGAASIARSLAGAVAGESAVAGALGPATDRDVYLSLSTDLEYTLDLALDFEYSLTLLVTVAEVAVTTVDIGDVVRIKGTFLNDASAAVDPSTVTFSVQEPDGTITSYAYGTSALVSKVSTGVYRLKFTPTDTGAHSVRCVGTGSGAAAEKTSFLVRDPY